MNQKAQRQEVQFPPLLNTQADRPHVASDFRSVEKINTPFMNGMLTPLWKKEEEYTNQPVWDFENNKYEVIEGSFTKNGERLFDVDEKHFEREDVTEEFSEYLAFNFAENGDLAKIEWETGTNRAHFTFRNVDYYSDTLFINGVLLSSRVRVFGDVAIGVIIFEVNSQYKMLYLKSSNQTSDVINITWCTKNIEGAITTKTIANSTPLINMSSPASNVYAISLISSYGEVLYTREEGFFTFVDDGTYHYTPDSFSPAGGSKSEVITTYNISNFIFNYTSSTSQDYFNVYKRDNKWYYVSDPTTEVPNSDDIAFNPQFIPNRTFEYEGVTYSVYNAVQYQNRIIFTSNVDNLYGKTASIEILVNSSEIALTAEYVDNQLSIDYTQTSWLPEQLRPVDGRIIFGENSYPLDNFRQFTITEEAGTSTITATISSAPNVFLDNGNLYNWYTTPEASVDTDTQPAALTQNSLIVESATFDGMDGNTCNYTVLESHLINQFTKYPRENSIAVGQNFWDCSLKMASDGLKSPRALYVGLPGSTTNKQPESTISATVKFTEYSNSNCSDMLYYTGTVPNNNQLFFPYATAGSEDVAWFNPGGFRSDLHKNWKLLYYVDAASGSVALQGISYAKNSDIGTLVTPLASIMDGTYIMAADDFIVYQDVHGKFYKISIEDGAVLSTVFDNKYIIINTTSFWNMWDEASTRKYHYATDYNGRVKSGFTRQEYRNTISTYYTQRDRRKWATAINNNYNAQPHLAVSSIQVPSIALSHMLNYEDVVTHIRAYNCTTEEAREVQAIDIYLQRSKTQDTNCRYLASIRSYPEAVQVFKDPNLVDMSYQDQSVIIYTTDIFTTFINGAGNNDFAIEGLAKYPLRYNNQSQPLFLYSVISGIDVDNVKWFFIIQGQYYSIIGEKLYAMIYSNGYISQTDAIVDIRDLYYVGNNPQIAFFVNPYTKQMYSFTGDAALQHIFDCGKFHFKFDENTISHWYDESNQSIYIATEEGLLVFGPQNTYLLEDFNNVKDIEFISGDIHIVDSDKITTLRYYDDVEGQEDLPIDIETSFWGLGANEITSIDRWQIVLYDPEHREQDIELQVRSLTDITTLAESKKIHINKKDWDDWSHSILVSFVPKLVKGKGIRLSIKAHSAIQTIVPHVMDNKASTTTKPKFEV